MPPRSVLDQALQYDPAGPATVSQGHPGFWDQVQGTANYYANEAAKQFIPKTPLDAALRMMRTAVDPLGLTGPIGDYEASYPKALTREASQRVGFKPALRDVLTAGAGGLAVMALPGEAESEAAGALADIGKVGRKVAPRSSKEWSVGNQFAKHLGTDEHVEDVPIHWLRRLAHSDFGDPGTFAERLEATKADIKANGFREPVVVQAGTRSRNATLEDSAHNMNIEAAARLGYTHVPVTIEMTPWAGRGEYGTTHLEEDIIPTHEAGPNQLELDVGDNRYMKPSDAFRSLQPGSSPFETWVAREGATSPRQRGYHGTTRRYGQFRETNMPGYSGAFDTQMGTHGGFDPAIASNFAGGDFEGSGGRIIPADIPSKEQMYKLEQETQPGSRYDYGTTGKDAYHRLQYDTYDMAKTIAERGFRRDPELMIPYLRDSVGAHGTDEQVAQMAQELAHGFSVQVRPFSQPKTLRQLLQEQYVGNLNWEGQNWKLGPNDPDFRQQIIQAARESFGLQGHKGYTYTNTAGHELQGAMDPTSFTVFTPEELKPPSTDPRGEYLLPQITEDMWRQLMDLEEQ